MSAIKKPRGDSLLKTLPPARQAEIFAHGQANTLAVTAKWLAEDGLKVSIETLSQFLSWYSLRSQFRQDEATTETLLEQLKQSVPGLTDEQLDELGQRTFSLLAIRRQDPETFVMVRSARTKAQLEAAKLKLREQAETRMSSQAKLAREKFQFDAAKAALAAVKELKTISTSKLSDVEKIRQTRLALFGELPEEQKKPS